MEQSTPFVRDHLKNAIAQYEVKLRKARRQAKTHDAAVIQRLIRWENTLTVYKRTLELIEKSAEVLEKSAGIVRHD
jgi:hypothetical protein